MIITLRNMLDRELCKEQLQTLPVSVQQTIDERLNSLLEAFGNPYLENGYGNTAIYVVTSDTVNRKIIVEKILQFYHINSTDELYEYSEIIGTGDTEVNYSETLYLLSNGNVSILLFCAID